MFHFYDTFIDILVPLNEAVMIGSYSQIQISLSRVYVLYMFHL
jgi:hypothetical protein